MCGAPTYDQTSVYETGRQCIWLLGSRDQLHVCHLAVGVSLSHAIADIGTMGGAATNSCTRPHDRRQSLEYREPCTLCLGLTFVDEPSEKTATAPHLQLLG